MYRRIWFSIILLLAGFIIGAITQHHIVNGNGEADRNPPNNYGVSATHPLAVEVGMEVLKNGGNAADAAVAVSYTLSVVEPYGSGIGGGGQMLLLPAGKTEPVVYDYRETAPSSKKRGYKVTGVPGFVKGMETIHQDHGSEPFEKLITPAIEIAEEGFEVDQMFAERLAASSYRLPVDDLPQFFSTNGDAIQPGNILKQPELANTLTKIKEKGSSAFYEGELAESLTEAVPYLDEEDLEEYEVEITEPVKGELSEGMIYSASPPLAGLPFVQSLKLAEELNIEETKDNEDQFVHLMTEISRVTNNDRVKEVGDPAFNDIDVNELVSDEHIEELADRISPSKVSNNEVDDGEDVNDDHTDTTHFVIVDQDGMMVSATNTLSNFFGTGKYTDGYFINNSIQHFSSKSKSPNSYEPGKRSRSFTAPSIFMNEDRIIGIGSPGGKRIPSIMSEVLTRHFHLDQSLEEAVKAIRFYGEDDYLFVEESFSENVREQMQERGYKVETKHQPIYFGGIQALEVNNETGTIYGIGDERRNGTWDAKKKDKSNE